MATTAAAARVPPTCEQMERIEEATSRCYDLIVQYGERDPHDDDAENPWRNPRQMLAELDRARDLVTQAWNNNNKDAASSSTCDDDMGDDSKVRVAYMDMITNAFADVLENMREDEALDVDVLVDCLQSGLDLMSSEEKELFSNSETLNDDDAEDVGNHVFDNDDDQEDDSTPTTPHQQRRIEAGVNVRRSHHRGV